MAKYKCNAPYPGSQVTGQGVIRPGEVFEVSDETPAREMWIPLDEAAKAAVERAKAATDKFVKEQAKKKEPDGRRFETLKDNMADGASVSDRADEKAPVLSPTDAKKAL